LKFIRKIPAHGIKCNTYFCSTRMISTSVGTIPTSVGIIPTCVRRIPTIVEICRNYSYTLRHV